MFWEKNAHLCLTVSALLTLITLFFSLSVVSVFPLYISFPPPILPCISQNDSVAESNEDVPPGSLNMLLTDISLVSSAAGRSLLWPDKNGNSYRRGGLKQLSQMTMRDWIRNRSYLLHICKALRGLVLGDKQEVMEQVSIWGYLQLKPYLTFLFCSFSVFIR